MTSMLVASGVAVNGRLAPLDLQVQGGSLLAVIGPNGGGKTSLLRALARIDRPSGAVWIDDEDLDKVPAPRRQSLLSFLPAARDVPWPIAARDVIGLGLIQPNPARVAEVIDLLDLRALADRSIDQLSTGERARVLLGRALAAKPRVLLLDEPLSNLDPYWALRILNVLTSVARSGSAVLLALHDLTLLESFNRALVVAGGKVVADGTPAQVTAGPMFTTVFGVERSGLGWRLRD
jgi:iron complex transport system ATP-binding protein